jgi:hypothetical protein
MSATAEGWDDTPPWEEEPVGGNNFGAFFLAVSLLLRRAGVQLLVLLTLLSLLQLGLQSPGWLISGATTLSVAYPGQYDWLVLVAAGLSLFWLPVSVVLTILAAALQLCLYRVARLAILFPNEMIGFGPAFAQLGKRYGWNLLAVLVSTVLITFGLIACVVPGIVLAVVLLPFPYLVAVGAPLFDAMSASFRLVLQNIGLVMAYVAFAFVLYLVWLGLNLSVATLLQLALPAWGPLISNILAAVVGVLVAMPGFLFHAALMVSLEASTWGVPMGVDEEIDG